MRVFSLSMPRYAALSSVLLAAATLYAFATRASFYRACVFLWTSKLVALLLANAALLAVYAAGTLLRRVFLGHLRPLEVAVRRPAPAAAGR